MSENEKVFEVTRSHLKAACDQKNWDLLDRLLEIDASAIDDNALYTDTWGEWWGLLVEVIGRGEADGLAVLLKHGAKRDLATWGDCIPKSPLEVAEGKPELVALLTSPTPPAWVRKTDPPLPPPDPARADPVNRQGEIRDRTGLVFQSSALHRDGKP